MPIIWDNNNTMKLELLGLDIQMKNLDIVNKSPLVDVTTIAPTNINEICCDQNWTSMSSPNQCTAISIPTEIKRVPTFNSCRHDF